MEARSASDPSCWQISLAARLTGVPPTRGELEELFTDAVARVPVLGYRVVGKGRRARFEPAPDLDVSRHVEEIDVPAGRPAAQCALEALARPLPTDRPPWSVQLIRGYGPDEYLLAYRVAHILQDGMGVARTLAAVLSGARLPHPAPRPAPAVPSPRAVRRAARCLPHLFGRTARWLPPRSATARGRVLRTVTLDRSLFDDITRRTGATTAQIGLAALAGALRAWTPEHWCGTAGRGQRRGLRFYMPVSLRPHEDRSAFGTAVGIMPLTLPCAEPSPERRLDILARDMGFGTLYQVRQVLDCLLRMPRPFSSVLYRSLRAFWPRRLGVTIVSMEAYGAGLDIVELVPVPSPQNRSPIVCAFVLERTRVTASFNAEAAIEGTERLPGLLAEALAELHDQGCDASGPAEDQHRVVAAEAE
ncbi:wax ester/triacylglycerol synthase domain-containing protein [Streptomyces sp. NPDC002537]